MAEGQGHELLRIEPCESWGKHILEFWDGEKWVTFHTDYLVIVERMKTHIESLIQGDEMAKKKTARKAKPKIVVIRRVFRYSKDSDRTIEEESVYGRPQTLVALPGFFVEHRACEFLSGLKPESIVVVSDHMHWNHSIIVYYRREELESDGPAPKRGTLAERAQAGDD